MCQIGTVDFIVPNYTVDFIVNVPIVRWTLLEILPIVRWTLLEIVANRSVDFIESVCQTFGGLYWKFLFAKLCGGLCYEFWKQWIMYALAPNGAKRNTSLSQRRQSTHREKQWSGSRFCAPFCAVCPVSANHIVDVLLSATWHSNIAAIPETGEMTKMKSANALSLFSSVNVSPSRIVLDSLVPPQSSAPIEARSNQRLARIVENMHYKIVVIACGTKW